MTSTVDDEPIKLAIIGTGGMGTHQIGSFGELDACKIVAVCDVSSEQASKVAKMAGPDVAAFTDVDQMLDKADIDAVSNCTPDRFHHPIVMKAISAGKHVLSEKPPALNYDQAREMADAAQSAGVINMINLSYRDAPAIQKAHQVVASGEIGRVIHVEASYYQSWLVSNVWGDWKTTPNWLWRLSTGHGSSGTLGDIGVHILDFASYPVGPYKSVRCQLRTFDKAPDGQIGEYVLDANDSVVVTAEFENGALGVIHATRWATGYQNRLALKVFGDKGAVRIDLDKDRHTVDVCSGDDVNTVAWRTVAAEPTPSNYERFLASIQSGVNDQPDFERGAQIQKVLDACFDANESGTAVSVR
jgi:predicted dehydrogenase